MQADNTECNCRLIFILTDFCYELYWPVLGDDEKVCKTCVAVNLLARVLSSDLQNVKQNINHYGKMIE